MSDSKHYTLHEQLGAGGMGVVFRAHDATLGRDVAIKFISIPGGDRNPRVLGRFIREAKACLALSHPNIVKILDVGEQDGRPFIAMELLDAVDLGRCLETDGALSVPQGITVLEQILDALAYCHDNGFLHRDIKPSNIMLERTGRAVLMDFGQVRHTDSTLLTEEGAMLGTPRYMAPEVARGEPPEARSDLWSLGVTAWEMFAGRRLFTAQSLPALLCQIETLEIPTLQSVRPDITPALSTLVARLVERDRERRWPDARSPRKRLMSHSLRLALPEPAQKPRTTTSTPRVSGPVPAPVSGGVPGVAQPPSGKTPSRPTPTTSLPPVSRSTAPPRYRPLALAGACLAIALLVLARSSRHGPAPGVRPPDVTFQIRALDQVAAVFSTRDPQRWWLRCRGIDLAVDPSPTTSHTLVFDPAEIQEITLGVHGGDDPGFRLPTPPGPREQIRSLATAIRASAPADAAVQRAYDVMRQILRRRNSDAGPSAISRYVSAEPALAASLDRLFAPLVGSADLDRSYRSLRRLFAAYLGSPSTTTADRWALVDALDRLEAHDVVATYIGRPPLYDPWPATAPTLEITMKSVPLSQASTYEQGLALAPPEIDVAAPPVTFLPSSRMSSYHIYPPGNAPPPFFDDYQATIAEMSTDIPNLKFGELLSWPMVRRGSAPAAVAVQILVTKFNPQMALFVTGPGPTATVPLRRTATDFTNMSGFVWATAIVRGALVPAAQGSWRLTAGFLFLDTARPNVRIDRVILRGFD